MTYNSAFVDEKFVIIGKEMTSGEFFFVKCVLTKNERENKAPFHYFCPLTLHVVCICHIMYSRISLSRTHLSRYYG